MRQTLNRLRNLVWPVYREEHRKFIPMFLMAFFICFNYYLLRTAKDTFVVTAKESGAEAIPFLKVWAILPAAFLVTFLFTRLSNYLSRKKVFYVMIGSYIAYFFLFSFVLYPFREELHLHSFADKLQTLLPEGFKGFIAMIRNWTFTSFYIMAEMWSTMILTILFWGFANDVTTVTEAKRFYGLFFAGTASSGIAAGLASSYLSTLSFSPTIPFGATGWDQGVVFMNLLMIGTSVIAVLLFWWLNKQGLGYTKTSSKAEEKSSIKMGMRENFGYIRKSPYLMKIAILVVTYNIAINLVEVIWKDQVKNLYPDPADYNAYMSQVMSWMSTITTAITLLFSGNLIRLLGWTTSAMIPPLVTLLSGILFFAALLAPQGTVAGICLSIGTTPVALAVMLGTIQNCLLRGTKYSLVDATKELAFVPLDAEGKLKGKAAIDGVGSRLGKSGGAFMYQWLLMLFDSVAGSIPVVSTLLVFALGGWIYSVKSLGKRFQSITESSPPLQAPSDNTQEKASSSLSV